MLFLRSILMLNQFNTDVNFLEFILWCDGSSEAFAGLWEYFHKNTTTCSHLHQDCTFPLGWGTSRSRCSTKLLQAAQSPSHTGPHVPKTGPKPSFENKRTQIIELSKRVCLGCFPFPFTCVHARVCIYFVRWSFKRKTWLEELFKTRNSRVVK